MLRNGQGQQAVPVALHVPGAQVDLAASAAQAATSAAVTKSDAPNVTITPKPATPTDTGGVSHKRFPDKPTLTILSNPQDGHSAGDIAINLPGALVDKINDPSNAEGVGMKAATAQVGAMDVANQIGAILCTARQIILNGVGFVTELTSLQIREPTWTLPEMAKAMSDHLSWALAWAAAMTLSPEDAITLAFVSIEITVKTVAFEPWRVPMQEPVKVLPPIAIYPPPPGNATDFPLDLFAPVYSKFCEDVGKNSNNTTSIVNWKGDKHPSLRSRLLRFMLRDGASDNDKYKDYKFTLGRYIRNGATQKRQTTSENAFQQLSSQDLCKRGDDKKAIASTGILDALSPRIEVTCRDSKSPFSAPKYDSGASGATSVESAIKSWCSQHSLTQLARDVPNIYGRSYTEGFKKCDPGSDRTHGSTSLLGSMEYSLEASGRTQEGNPPWEQKADLDLGEEIHADDFEKAIDAVCQNGAAMIKVDKYGGSSYQYPPKGQLPFYYHPKSGYNIVLHFVPSALDDPTVTA
ncbi:hypothetical protein CC86DRAFT_426966 [Ophiobolus disseminans]|uniref:Uncharacterized protein n=1 Tax=Ophiobolus disseminans TaxID=1469910 RepID=A0A6A6ZMW0_9PLEO|nr:hypothetical protein CC86DRAFT_426966 [Ophiobolus disseminans]